MSKEKKTWMKEEIRYSVLSSVLRQPEWIYLFVSLNSINLVVTVASVWLYCTFHILENLRLAFLK